MGTRPPPPRPPPGLRPRPRPTQGSRLLGRRQPTRPRRRRQHNPSAPPKDPRAACARPHRSWGAHSCRTRHRGNTNFVNSAIQNHVVVSRLSTMGPIRTVDDAVSMRDVSLVGLADTARHGIECRLTQGTRVRNACRKRGAQTNRHFARQLKGFGCRLTRRTRVQTAWLTWRGRYIWRFLGAGHQ